MLVCCNHSTFGCRPHIAANRRVLRLLRASAQEATLMTVKDGLDANSVAVQAKPVTLVSFGEPSL
jgi:hypothetical protein